MPCGSRAIQSAVLDGFGDMRSGDRIRAGEIGDGARHFEDAVIGARRQAKAHDGLFQQGFALRVRRTVALDFAGGEPGVGFVLPRQRAFAGRS